MTQKYDAIIIGTGQAGSSLAARAAPCVHSIQDGAREIRFAQQDAASYLSFFLSSGYPCR